MFIVYHCDNFYCIFEIHLCCYIQIKSIPPDCFKILCFIHIHLTFYLPFHHVQEVKSLTNLSYLFFQLFLPSGAPLSGLRYFLYILKNSVENRSFILVNTQLQSQGLSSSQAMNALFCVLFCFFKQPEKKLDVVYTNHIQMNIKHQQRSKHTFSQFVFQLMMKVQVKI